VARMTPRQLIAAQKSGEEKAERNRQLNLENPQDVTTIAGCNPSSGLHDSWGRCRYIPLHTECLISFHRYASQFLAIRLCEAADSIGRKVLEVISNMGRRQAAFAATRLLGAYMTLSGQRYSASSPTDSEDAAKPTALSEVVTDDRSSLLFSPRGVESGREAFVAALCSGYTART
jgi:hypothetical protein